MIHEPKDASVRSEKVFTCFDYLTFTVLTVLVIGRHCPLYGAVAREFRLGL